MMTRSDHRARVAIVWAGAALVLALAACADAAGPTVDRDGATTTPREVRLVPMLDGTVAPEQALSTTIRLPTDNQPAASEDAAETGSLRLRHVR